MTSGCDAPAIAAPDPRSAPLGSSDRTIVFFGHDSAESTVIKRANAFAANGWRVIGFMFRRVRDGQQRAPSWENVELGITVDLHYGKRLAKLVQAIVIILMNARKARAGRIFYARNIDMLFIAVVSRFLTGAKPILVYEALDVPRAVLGNRPLNKLMRLLERVLLKSCHLLVVSSPAYMSKYFTPVQDYRGPWHLLENKISATQMPVRDIQRVHVRPAPPPWIIGWFGVLRCVRSVELLCSIAQRLGDRVIIHVRGLASEEYLPSRVIRNAAEVHRNFLYLGPYASPYDLTGIYSAVHFSWCVDYLDAGTNSDWLLPNRIYEGGLFGAVALARKNTATGRMIESHGLGFTFEEPLDRSVAEFIQGSDAEDYARARRIVESKATSTFVDETDTAALLGHLEALEKARLPRIRGSGEGRLR